MITAPYTNPAGTADSFVVLLSKTDVLAARGVFEKRNLRLLLLCRTIAEGHIAVIPKRGNLLYRRLTFGRPPSWLLRVPLPRALGKDYLLYRRVP
jgi:hypothetical protein